MRWKQWALAFLVCGAVLAPMHAHAQLVAAAADGAGIAFAYRVDTPTRWSWAVFHSIDGTRFEQVDTGANWVLALHVLDDGTLLMANAVSRSQAVLITRVRGATRSEAAVPDSSASSDVRFAAYGRRIVMLDPAGGFVSRDDGRTFHRFAEWDSDGYGFHAASYWLGPRGLDALVPQFNTCSSSDHLEGATRHHAQLSGGVQSRQLGEDTLGAAIALGRYGATYSADVDDAGLCTLRSSRDGAALATTDICQLSVASSARFTVAVFGRSVLRLRDGRAVELHTAPHRRALAVYPDSHGRALALTEEHRLMRYSANAPPTELFPTR